MKNIYVVRHCSANGQNPDAQLTPEGLKQAEELIAFFADIKIDTIVSSPYKRAMQTIEPLAKKRGLPIEEEARLTERIFSTVPVDNWREMLKLSMSNPDLVFEGGESGREAQARIIAVMEEVFSGPAENIVLVSHGNLILSFLQTINEVLSFKDWQEITNPDIFLITQQDDRLSYERIWDK